MATARYIDTELRSQIGLQLRGRLKEMRLSQENAAKLAGVHRTAFSRYVNGRATPRGEALAKLCEIFDLSIQIGKKRLTAKDLKAPARESGTHYQYTLPFDQPMVFQVGGGALAFEITRKPAAKQLELIIRFKNLIETSA